MAHPDSEEFGQPRDRPRDPRATFFVAASADTEGGGPHGTDLDETRPYDCWGGLTRPSPEHQSRVAESVPREADGSPTRFPDPRKKWSAVINDGGPSADPLRGNNCLDCSLSLISTWHGEPRVSAPRFPDRSVKGQIDIWSGEGEGPARAARWLGHSYQHLGTPEESFRRIERKLRKGGHGAAADIVTSWKEGGSHAWNAVNYKGKIVWIDTQVAQTSSRPLYPTDDVDEVWAIVLDEKGKRL